jgi:hypothetical protein
MTDMMQSSKDGEEEWIHITDISERKRIQNRVSQRNYRKMLYVHCYSMTVLTL